MILVRPDISVVIPFHNAGKFFPEALRSVKSQTLPPSKLSLLMMDQMNRIENYWKILRGSP